MISKLLKKNEKGFTLMEMLIVVAIIAVLIAIAIPTFTASLNKAKVATDEANIRAGYASAMAELIAGHTTLLTAPPCTCRRTAPWPPPAPTTTPARASPAPMLRSPVSPSPLGIRAIRSSTPSTPLPTTLPSPPKPATKRTC